ncbi:MAG: glycosyltransferase family 2 protein [Ardenticatenaceae bacterium]
MESNTVGGARESYQASVIVVCTNELHHLLRCLPALLTQTHASYEVVVVDNASSDGSREYVQDLLESHSHLRIITNQDNLGYVGANNVGFANSDAELLIVLNPDTEPEADWLSELVKAFDEPDVGLATSKIVMMYDRSRLNTCGNDMSVISLVVCRGLGKPATGFSEAADVAAVSGAAFAIRRSVLEKIGYFDSSFFIYYEDTELSLRARLAGYRCVYVPTSVVAHDYKFKFSTKKAFWQERNRYYSILKIFDWRTIILLSPWFLLGDLVAFGYCALQSRQHVFSKLRAYMWIIQHWGQIMENRRRTQALRAVPDSHLLQSMVPEISAAGATEGWLQQVVEKGLQPFLQLGSTVSKQVSW